MLELLRWKKKGIVTAFLIAVLIVSSGILAFHFLQRPRTAISEEEAISNVRTYFDNKYLSQQVDNFALFEEVDIEVNDTELRPPEELEITTIRQVGQKPPDLLWIVKVTVNPIPVENVRIDWITPPPFHKTVYLNAHTGNVLLENSRWLPTI